ncbi:alcohol dehydrogenase [Drosophila novamexicana]|uniref:alcohol dehydrogenase n=1 Tax=Drosophila novamexicana TaxID=47314 RepID=UPI0011E604B2|nr:alcohol dehydrogenase [Drosophila novamexicana]
MDLAGKNVVYLGGFGGIGQKVCAELLERQLKALAVFDLAPNDQLLGAWQAKYPNTEIFYQKVDITQKPELEAAYKAAAARLQHFDLVVNGMGLMNDHFVELTIQINLLGLINSSLLALEHMDQTKGGRGGLVVNISSVAGLQPTPLMAIYSAAKHGVTAFTRGLADAAYYARTGVAFITICPGFTDTPLLADMLDKTTFSFETPMKKIIPKVKRQPPEVCASNMVKVIEQAQNGGVWMLDVGEIEELDMPVMWKPVLQD